MDSFYRSFEDKHRGSQEEIKSRLEIYLPFVKPLLEKSTISKHSVLDLGCGRGEWLELLKEQGFIAKGVDLDEGMLDACHQQGLQTEQADALDYLQALKNESMAVISGFHIAEHLPFNKLKSLVEHALRVLKPGGLLILETPNPENIVVGTSNFYLDPTHERPLPPQLLSFIAKHAGFKRVKVLRLQEAEGLVDSQNLSLMHVLAGVSPDYSIIAQKKAEKKILEKFDTLFSKEYGVTLNEIADLYEKQLKEKIDSLKEEWNENHKQQYIHSKWLKNEFGAIKATNETALAEQRKHSEWLQNEWNEIKATTDLLNAALQHKSEALAASEAALSVQQKHSEWLQNEWNASKKKNDDLQQLNHHYSLESKHRHTQLLAVYESSSWKITWPLRKLAQWLSWGASMPIRFILWVGGLPKRIVRRCAIKIISFALRYPSLKIRAISWLRNYPRLDLKLRQWALMHKRKMSHPHVSPEHQDSEIVEKNTVSVPINEQCANDTNLSYLTPNARHIYEGLKIAMEQHGQESR